MENRVEYMPNITAEQIHQLELRSFGGRIALIDNMHDFRRMIKLFDDSPLLGFDTETKPSFRKGKKNKVSLVQLANSDTACLFRINRIGLPDELKKVMARADILKAGVAIHDDLRFLGNIARIQPDGFVDLQKFVKQFGIESAGLKKLTAIILGFRISKSQQVTDWEAERLSEAQQLYAATDAWVCHEIYKKLVNGSANNEIKTNTF
jgi:ribonuclease D